MKKPINASREIQKGMDAFIKYLKHERNASKHTVRAYENELKAFAAYLGPEILWKDIDHVLVRGFLADLHSKGLSKVCSRPREKLVMSKP